MKKTVLVVDDESLARQRLIKMLEAMPGFELVAEADSGEQALAAIKQFQPDIVLLDIRMPGLDGMAVAKTIEAEDIDCDFIFTTAYDEYAVDAFDVQAKGYLLKPIKQEKLAKVLHALHPESDGKTRNHLSASSRGNIELIPLDTVRLLQAEHKYVTVYHNGGESILDESLKTLECEFPQRFKRVHRNALVSVEHVCAMEKNSEGQFILKIADTDIQPIVSRRLVADVRLWLKQL